MDVSTAEFYDAIKEIAQGNTTNAVSNAKRVSDYVEQTKQTNYTTVKDVFLTKDDKTDIINKFGDLPITLKNIFLTKDDKVELVKLISDSKNSLVMWMFVFWVGQVAVILSYILKKLLNPVKVKVPGN